MMQRTRTRVENTAHRNKEAKNAYEYYLDKVSALHGVSIAQIKGRSRRKDIVAARQMVSWLMYTKHPFTLEAIGEMVQRHHSTIIHSIEVVNDRLSMPWDKTFAKLKKIDPYRSLEINDNWHGDGME